MNSIIILPVVLPLFASIFIAKYGNSSMKRNIYVGIITTINLLIVIYLSVYEQHLSFQLLKINTFLDISFKIDKLSIFFSVLVSVLWLLTSVYAMEYMKHEGKEKQFFAYFLATLGITLGIAYAANLITMYLFYELLTLSTYPLVIHSEAKEAMESGKKYLIYSFTGATVALFAMILVYGITNNLTFTPGGVLNNINPGNKNLLFICYITAFLGFGVKAAIVPFHAWLPNAMVAPTPVSALLHAVAVVKSGVYAVTRTTFYIFGADVVRDTGARYYLMILVAITILMGSFLALKEENLKKRLAYSTISQLGYILLGVLLLNREAFVGAMLHMLNHAVIKITLFFCVGSIMYTTHKTDISQIKGIGRIMPVMMWCFTISAVSLVGIPPTNGFISKWFLAEGALTDGNALLPAILLISAMLTALYLFPIITAAFFKKEDDIQVVKKDAPVKMLIPITIITAITLFLGLYPAPVISFLKQIALEIMP